MAMEQYDVFISCNSEDYDLANDVYNFLLENDITCFFAGRNISESGNSNYREVIDNAIDKSDNMIVVGSSIDNINSEWVKAEWNLFINEQRSGRKRGNLITILKKGVRTEDLELSLRGVQSFSLDNYEDLILSYIKKGKCKKSPINNLKQRGRVHKCICVTISFLLAIFACFFVTNRISPISSAKDLYIKSFKKQKKIELGKKWEELSAIANQMDSIYSVARKCSYLLEESYISKLPDIDEYIFEVRNGFDVPVADWGARIEEMDENIELSELNPNLINFVRSIEEYNQNHKILDSLFVFCDSLRAIEVPLEIRLIELRKIQCVSILGSYKYIIILCGTFIGVFFLSYLIFFYVISCCRKKCKGLGRAKDESRQEDRRERYPGTGR